MSTTPSTAQPATRIWRIDPVHSFVEFSIKHMKIATVRGRFADISGTLVLNEQDIANSSIEVDIDAASIDTHNENRDRHLRSPDFFDVARYPTLHFRSTRITQTFDDIMLVGDLTIHGVTHQILFAVYFNGEAINPDGKRVVSYSATTSLNRKDFGLNWNAAVESGGLLVGEDVKVTIEIEAVSS